MEPTTAHAAHPSTVPPPDGNAAGSAASVGSRLHGGNEAMDLNAAGEGARVAQAAPAGGQGGGNGDGSGKPPRRRGWQRGGRVLLWLVAVIFIVVVALAGTLAWVVHTDTGTRTAWRIATYVLKGRLSGVLDGGALQNGIRMHDVRWHSGATDIRIDRLAGRWRLHRVADAPALPIIAAPPVPAPMTASGVATSAASSVVAASTAGAPSTSGDTALSTGDGAFPKAAGTASPGHLPHWRFTVDYLRVGTVDVRTGPSSGDASSSLTMPTSLRSPLQFEVRDVRVERIALHGGGDETDIDELALQGASDGRHHAMVLQGVRTPYGTATAGLAIDGVAPFALHGDLRIATNVKTQAVTANATLSGNLEALKVHLDATGYKLAARADIEASPFAAVPFRTVSIAADHIDPSVLSAGAPSADLRVRALLSPVASDPPAGPAASGAAIGAAAAAPTTASTVASNAASPVASAVTPNVASSAAASPAARRAAVSGLVVAGTIDIDNAIPGRIDAQRLPFVSAHARVQLDATRQVIDALRIALLDDASITGSGQYAQGKGQLDLRVSRLDLHAVHSALRRTALGGDIGVRLDGAQQNVTLQLADPHARIALRGTVKATATQTMFDAVRLNAGDGELRLDGTLGRDADAKFALKGTLHDVDPLALLDDRATTQGATPARRARGASGRVTNGDTGIARRGDGTAKTASERQGDSTTRAAHRTTTAAKTTAPIGTSVSTGGKRIQARVSGKFDVTGRLAPTLAARIAFALGDSEYNGLPLTGDGTVQLAGSRLLPSRAHLSVAGNLVDLNGSFGARGDRLAFRVDAPDISRLGFGLSGAVQAQGDVTGSIAHPDVTARYDASHLVFGTISAQRAHGQAELRDGANGALNLSVDGSDIDAPGVTLQTLSARIAGTRAKHTIDATMHGSVHGNLIDASIAAQGGLFDAAPTRQGKATPARRDAQDKPTEGTARAADTSVSASSSGGGMGWRGTISRLENRGTPAIALAAPVSVVAAPGDIELGRTQMTLEGATIDIQSLFYRAGQIRSAGRVASIDVGRLLALQAQMTDQPAPQNLTDLVFDGDWNLSLADTASGYLQLQRRSGDIQITTGQGRAGLGLEQLRARVDFTGARQAHLTVQANAARIGQVSADLHAGLVVEDGMLTVGPDSALSGTVTGDVPSLRTTGGLLGPAYLFDGALALRLQVAGTFGRPRLSGSLKGSQLNAQLLDQGVQLRDGVIDIGIDENLMTFRQVVFHGSSGTLRATGQVRLDADDPTIAAKIVADKLELFGTPDRQLQLSGQATLENAGPEGGVAVDGKFVVDHALFDLPESSAPSLGDDVVIVRSNGQPTPAVPKKGVPGAEKPVGKYAPRANISIDLGRNFRFRGEGADLGLTGGLTVVSAPNVPLSAQGSVNVANGSTYTAFGRKLNIETGFFTFNGPIDNPSINLLAMRRNQEVEAGVRVRGTLRAPDAQLVSEPSVPDNEKLSWLLFGHGTDSGQNLGQQNTVDAALALLGSAGGKRIAQTVGLDEFTIGSSDSGLTDAQVVQVAKALNEHFVLGYEQALQSTGSLFKLTWLLSRSWSVALQAGTYNGVFLLYVHRFD
ncbi:translocation/assembly module TamB domain-containing protein [Robbsia andropogonis]|uniref:translocation/assembly module TamB domain-containing protein n=1 Tax=Robbsia andropogonis TaxID=28092 RepID=UPI0009E1BF41|nr:translocation/assembly module TamB domain-containing protein [Robbsia andropogonis]